LGLIGLQASGALKWEQPSGRGGAPA
jgi:hypothetical protein